MRAKDPAGNWSDKVSPYVLNIDITAPDAPHIDHVIDNVGDWTGEVTNGMSTDDNKPVISGTSGEAGLTIVVYNVVDGGKVEVGRTTGDKDGNWTLSGEQYKSPLASDVKLMAEAFDRAGNESGRSNERDFYVGHGGKPDAPVITGVLDDYGPVTGNVLPNGVTDDKKPTIQGTAGLADCTVHVYVDGVGVGTTTVNSLGEWHYRLEAELSDGNHLFKATLVNGAGNISAYSSDYPIEVKTTPPDGVTLLIDKLTGDDVIDATEAAGNVDITGTSTGTREGDIVTLTINGKDYTGTVDAAGNWTVTGVAGSDLVDDSDHVVDGKLHATDAAGNFTDVTTTHGYEVRLVPTAIAQISAMDKDSGVSAADWLTNNGAAGRLISGTLNGTLNAGEKVQVSTDSGSTWTDAYVSGNKWDVMDPNAHSGNWTIQTRVVNSSGMAGTVSSQAVILDQVAPSHATDLTYANNVATVAFNGADKEVGDLVDVIVAGKHFSHALTAAEIAAGSASVAVSGATLVGDIQAALVDRAGNVSDYLSMKSRVLRENFEEQTLDGNGSMGTGGTGMAVGTTHDLGNMIITYMKAGPVNRTGVADASTYPNSQWGNVSKVLEVGGVLRVDLKDGNSAWKISADFYDIQSGSFKGQCIRFYDDSTLVDTWDLHQYANTTQAGYFNGNYLYTVQAGATFNRFEIDSGNDWIALDNLILNPDTPDYRVYTAASAVQTLIAGSADYYGDNSNNTFNVADVAALNSTGVHGNGGLDTLKLTGAGQLLDVSVLIKAGKLDGVEVLDITGSGNNTVSLELGDVLHLGEKNAFITDDHLQLMVKGDLGDQVSLGDALPDGVSSGHWLEGTSETIDGLIYNTYRFVTTTGTAFNKVELLIQQDVSVELVQHDVSISLVEGVSGVRMALAATADDAFGSEYLAQQPDIGTTNSQASDDTTQQSETVTALNLPTQIHEIQGLSDTFFGAPSESKVVSLWASASDYLASDANQGIHGGNGVDVLKVEGHDQVLDLTSAHGKITGMEVIDLSGDGANTLKLSLQDVLDNGQADLFHSTDKHSVQMMVQGNSDDVVNLDHQSAAGKDGTWSDKGTMAVGEVSYHVYQNSTGDAELLIQQGVQVHLV
ncbi:hypothetical protein UB43_20670 [Pseudomonas sp. 21]|uniref:Ig-like domain-containing protein n=2 Tax=unclassified Pseudomonas TaxID=196821 RepID=UPI0005EB9428|nr:Ig-like domain-containing protein [Pseudomonas sp. 21]KJJ97930.1 hypothetical protein UB43_20670 [Pseudomonas sp. 21]